jgi:hypothetical protein
MTPGRDWRADYAQLPTALAKLELCAAITHEIESSEPLVTAAEPHEDVRELAISVQDYYRNLPAEGEPGAAGLDGDLRSIFDDLLTEEPDANKEMLPAGALILKLERQLMADVFRWTGHFPEKTRSLVRDLAKRADALRQVYPRGAESQAGVSVTILVTSLAMNFVHRGAYFPEAGRDEPREPATAAAPAAPGVATPARESG